jgi:hypothetical protein
MRSVDTASPTPAAGAPPAGPWQEPDLPKLSLAMALLDMEGGDFAAGGLPPAGEFLTGNIGSLRELAATKRASRSLRTYTSI